MALASLIISKRQRIRSSIPPAKLMEEIASDEVIDEAYRWLCRRRGNYSHNYDV
jgi:hypothetical protein